jgi:hypothetical protein
MLSCRPAVRFPLLGQFPLNAAAVYKKMQAA